VEGKKLQAESSSCCQVCKEMQERCWGLEGVNVLRARMGRNHASRQ